MAGHLPIKQKAFHTRLLKEFKDLTKADIKSVPFYKRFENQKKGYYLRLPDNYFMDEEHGKVDDEVICYTPSRRGCSFEIHLDKECKINEVYLVM